MKLFFKRHSFSEKFHKKYIYLTFFFGSDLFQVGDDRSISTHGIYVDGGQDYKEMNMTFHPSQNNEDEFK